MKSITTALAAFSLFLLASTAFGQPLPNPGFEEWQPSGKEPPFDWEEPSGWKSTNGVTEFITAGVTKSGTAHSGGFSCSIHTLNVFGSNVPGGIANGNPALNFSTYSFDLMTAGTPISNRPDQLSGYYQFISSAEGDYGYAVIILKKYNSATKTADVVGMGASQLSPASNFTPFTVQVAYQKNDQPDSVIVAFFSSDPTNPKDGGTLLVDDVALVTDGAGVETRDQASAAPLLYPNPASGSVHVEVPGGVAKERTIIFYDLLGREVMSRTFNESRGSVDLPTQGGTYAYRLIDGEGGNDFVGTVIVRGE